MTLKCSECPYETESGNQFLEHLLTYHRDKAEKIFMKFVNEGKIKIIPTTENKTIKELLDEIISRKGAYSRDRLQHAENVIDYHVNIALEIKKRFGFENSIGEVKETKTT